MGTGQRLPLSIVPAPIIDQLRQGKKTRDILAHSFFRDHDLAFMTQAGRVEMIDFCEAAVAQFKAIDEELDAFCRPYRNRYGMTDEWIEQKYQEMHAQAQRDHGPTD